MNDWFQQFQEGYNKYRKDNPTQSLPEYSDSIGHNFYRLVNSICELHSTPDLPGTTLDHLTKDSFRLVEYLRKGPIVKITFHGSDKGDKHNLTNEQIIGVIIDHVFDFSKKFMQQPLVGSPGKNLSRLLATSKEIILKLKADGITDELLAEFIPNAVIQSGRSSLWMNPKFDKEGASVVPIKSIEAFKQAMKPSRTKPPKT